MRSEFDPFDPFNLGNERFIVWITIRDQFVNIVGSKGLRGRIVKIRMMVGSEKVQWIPSGDKIGVWMKGRPADIEFERVPPELRIIDISHIEKMQIEVNQFG